jgi:hypothetical protein
MQPQSTTTLGQKQQTTAICVCLVNGIWTKAQTSNLDVVWNLGETAQEIVKLWSWSNEGLGLTVAMWFCDVGRSSRSA